MKRHLSLILIATILAVALIWKVILLGLNAFPFNADEAVVALMARHILMGERPIFFYGQAYMGSLDAFLVAGSFLVFGQKIIAIRMVQIFLYSGTIITTVLIAKMVFKSFRTGILVGFLLAIPSVNLTLYTTVSLGGYGEALLIGNLILLIGIYCIKQAQALDHKINLAWVCGFGFLSGLGFWANALTLVYSASVGLGLIVVYIKQKIPARTSIIHLGIAAISFMAGCFPVVIFGFQNGISPLLREIAGSAVNVEMVSFGQKVILHIENFFLFGTPVIFGFRPPWEIRWLALPLIPFIMAFWLYVLWYFLRKMEKDIENNSIWIVFLGIFCILIGAFIFTSFGIDPSGRYFLPLNLVLSIIASGAIVHLFKHNFGKYICFWIILAFHLVGTLQCAQQNPPGITTQFDLSTVIDHSYDRQLIEFLEQNGEWYGYSNYWVSYPLAFQSQEKLIFIPRLPYHADLRYTSRDDRYSPYDKLVETAHRIALITTNNPVLDQCLQNMFFGKGIQWEEKDIGYYTVYYHLSGLITDAEIELANCRNE